MTQVPHDVPDVSVVIPTFRRPTQLREAIDSALLQQRVTVEVIVVDDSPEGSAEPVVQAVGDARVSYRKMETPTGGSPAYVRNTGWPHARGRFVHFLDDDDHAAPGAYAALVRALEEKPEAGVAFGRVAPFGDHPPAVAHEQAYFDNAQKRARLAAKSRSRRVMVANMLFKPTVLVCSACLIRREHVAPLGGFDHDTRVVEDVDFYIRAIRRFGYVFVDRAVVEYRVGAPSLMHSKTGEERVLESYQNIFANYRRAYGVAEFAALKALARTAFRWL